VQRVDGDHEIEMRIRPGQSCRRTDLAERLHVFLRDLLSTAGPRRLYSQKRLEAKGF
jgi:hypothetical protein